jgi:hypothetical protein
MHVDIATVVEHKPPSLLALAMLPRRSARPLDVASASPSCSEAEPTQREPEAAAAATAAAATTAEGAALTIRVAAAAAAAAATDLKGREAALPAAAVAHVA